MLKRLSREPLLHFLLLSGLIFLAYGLVNGWKVDVPDRITITAARSEQLAAVFARTWQRPPTESELQALIDDYVKEEVYYREAQKLGLDTDDTVIRRRMRLKMEFLGEAEMAGIVPAEAELQAYLDAHALEFGADPEFSFAQIFFNPDKRGDRIGADAALILADIGDADDPTMLGDPTLLPVAMPLTPASGIAGIFGQDFVIALATAEPGQWAGPVVSTFGLHLVRVGEQKAGHVPELAEIRADVEREWMNARRFEMEKARFGQLLANYDVVIEPAAADLGQ